MYWKATKNYLIIRGQNVFGLHACRKTNGEELRLLIWYKKNVYIKGENKEKEWLKKRTLEYESNIFETRII